MASSRKLPLSYTTSTYGDATRDYTSLAAWESDTDTNLVTATNGEVLDVYDDSSPYSDLVTLAGAVTSSDYFRVIRAVSGQEPKGLWTQGPCFTGDPGITSGLIYFNENYSAVYDLRLEVDGSSIGYRYGVTSQGGYNVAVGIVSKNINPGSINGGIFWYQNKISGPCYAINCISFDFSAANGGGFVAWGSGVNCFFYNCTAVNCGYNFYRDGGTPIAKNCISDSPVTSDYFGTWTQTTCLDDTDGVVFNDAANDDYHLGSSDTAAKDNGTDLSADSDYAFDDDIDLTTRSGSWDIGADEYETPSSISVTLTDIETDNPFVSSPSINDNSITHTQFKDTSFLSWVNTSNFRWKSIVTNVTLPVTHPTVLVSEIYPLVLANDIEEIYGISAEVLQIFELLFGLRLGTNFVESYQDALQPLKLIKEYYSDTTIPIRTIVSYYNDAFTPTLKMQELYEDIPSALAVIWEIYRDSPLAKKQIEEYYNDTPISTNFISMRYNSALISKIITEERYSGSIEAINIYSETYGISDSVIQKTIEEYYDLTALNPIGTFFDEIYYMLPDSTVAPTITASLFVDGVEIDFIGIELEISIDQYTILGTITIADEANFVKCNYLSDVVCTLDSTTYSFFIENKTKTIEHTGIQYQINVVSPTVKLDSPYSSTLIESFPSGIQAETLVNQMAAVQSISVDYQLLDWFIPSYAISIKDETPLSVIRRIANAAGGVVQTKPDGTLLLISKYETSPKDWDSVVSGNVFSSTEHITYLSETLQINDGYNAFLITDQGSSSSNISLREVTVNANTKIIRGFRIPFTDGPFDLETSGGSSVVIDKYMYPIEENVPIADLDGTVSSEWEYVEFIDWVGKTIYPIYDVIDSDWEEDDLGAFQVSEDGTLEIIDKSSVPSESLLRIKYKTKYWKWTVTGIEGKHVQFYVPEEV
jgi:hypothetical protein